MVSNIRNESLVERGGVKIILPQIILILGRNRIRVNYTFVIFIKNQRMKNKILFVVSLLFGLMMINAGLNKFFHYMPMPDDIPMRMKKVMSALLEIGWLLPLVAVIEILGGVLVITNKFRGLGAIMLLPIMVGILLTNIFTTPSGLPLAIALFVINLWILWENKEKYARMVW